MEVSETMSDISIWKKKIELAKQSLRPDDAWIIYTAEQKDQTFELFGLQPVAATVLIISKKLTYLICGKLDFSNVPNIFDKSEFWAESEEFKKKFFQAIQQINPRNIFLNYSKSDIQADFLGHGSYLNLIRLIRKSKVRAKINSALHLIYRLFNKKTPEEIKRISKAAKISHQIILKAFSQLKTGMTEIDIYNLIHKLVENYPEKLEFAWAESMCPIVLIGKRIGKTENAHSKPTRTRLKPGNMIYVDFGLRYKGYGSDIQRAAYMLKPKENFPPAEIQRRFDTTIKSINAAAKALVPKKTGKEVDLVARKVIIDTGYPEYEHGTGHPIGKFAHSPGPSLSKHSKKANIEIEEGYVFTIEPRITLPNGCSIEEDVIVTKNGAKFLSPRQTKLFLIKAS